MTEAPPPARVPLSHLPSEEKTKRSSSFGSAASHYERFRPGPPLAAVEWTVPSSVGRIVDLGAGTGALTRLLSERAEEVIAVEPDDRMREVLARQVPGCRALDGRGESIPVSDRSADAVLASSSWHWMDPLPTLHEVGRVLVPDGVLGVVWSGPDPEGAFLAQARALMAERPGAGADHGEEGRGANLGDLVMAGAKRPSSILEIPDGVPFDQPDRQVFRWDVALNADELIGLLATFSWVITLPEETRSTVLAEARRLLVEVLGIEGAVTVDVAFRAEAWRTRRRS